MKRESITSVKILQEVQEKQRVQVKQNLDAQTEMERTIGLGVRAVKSGPETRASRIEQARARLKADAYQQDSMAIARKLLGIEDVDSPV